MIVRSQCPCCSQSSAESWLRTSMDHPSMRRHFEKLGAQVEYTVLSGHHFEICHCPGCSLLFQKEVLEDSELGMIYGTHVPEALSPSPAPLTSLCHLAQDALLMRQLVPPSSPTPHLLDYGLGWSRFSIAAQSFGFKVSGVEISEACRSHARRHNIELVDSQDLPETAFDAVMIDQVLEHLADPSPVMKSLFRSLKPGGVLLAGTPGVKGAPSRLKKAGQSQDPIPQIRDRDLDAISPLIHINLFTAQSLRTLAEKAGFTTLRPSILLSLTAGMLWSTGRQWNRNLYLPIKYWMGKGTRLWFQKSP